MAAIIRKAYYGYQVLFNELPDPRTKSWPLVAKPYQGLLIIALYLMFVFKWGPAWMKNRRPFNLKKMLLVYNAGQVVFCVYLFHGAILTAWGWKYKWICEPVDYTVNEVSMTIAKFVYLYYLSKIVDLLDTVFFVLRKKFNQVSFLHVYHHAGMMLLTWAAATYYPGGHGTLIGVINSFVHIVMYSYYFLTVAFPVYKESIWWKKHITQLQIMQFFLCVVHMSTIVFKPDCEFPRWTAAVFLPQNLFMLILFIDFYIKAYIKKPSSKVNGVLKEIQESEQRNRNENKIAFRNKSALNSNGVERNGKTHNNGTHKSILNGNGILEIRTETGIKKET